MQKEHTQTPRKTVKEPRILDWKDFTKKCVTASTQLHWNHISVVIPTLAGLHRFAVHTLPEDIQKKTWAMYDTARKKDLGEDTELSMSDLEDMVARVRGEIIMMVERGTLPRKAM